MRWLAEAFGAAVRQGAGRSPATEAPTAGWSTPREAMRLFGYPRVPLARLIDWTADWVGRGMPSLGKDTISTRAMASSDPALAIETPLRAGRARRRRTRWCARPAGTRSPPTGASFSISAPSMRCATARPRDRDRRHPAVWRPLRLDQHGAGRGRAIAGSGLATRLLRRCIDDLTPRGLVPVLDATPAGREVYAPLGFEDAWGFTALDRAAADGPRMAIRTAIAIRPIADAVWPELCAYDAARVRRRPQRGARAPARAAAGRRAVRRARRARRRACCSAATAARPSQLGPLVAEDDATARALLARALDASTGRSIVDLADAQGARSARWLEARGFAPQRPFTRMLLGRSARASTTRAHLCGGRTRSSGMDPQMHKAGAARPRPSRGFARRRI